ncbi:hypothetical protein BJ741DRAFT_713340 [Chytriomyces cf. hyalinus JEL632]|nr:hypothetical protein BJ741DRAFT_713340 [Chytriomyces cf. hyalinus JEL632]
MAVAQLQRIHESNYVRAANNGSGLDWAIPIADSVFDLDKTEFGLNYVQKSREAWPDMNARDAFQQCLCNCHTIHIKFPLNAFVEDSFDKAMLKLLTCALKEMFITPPSLLENTHALVYWFMVDLTDAAGPVFIVLDEIGGALQGNELEKRDQFMAFCHEIIGSWFDLQELLFVVLESDAFLNQY